jgi:hypothetical protein
LPAGIGSGRSSLTSAAQDKETEDVLDWSNLLSVGKSLRRCRPADLNPHSSDEVVISANWDAIIVNIQHFAGNQMGGPDV